VRCQHLRSDSRSQSDTSPYPFYSGAQGRPDGWDLDTPDPIPGKTDLLLFDDWLRDPLSLTETQQLLDILDDRCDRSSTLLVAYYPVGDGPLRFQDPTLADAILDRLVPNAYRVERVGETQRKLRSDALKPST
jgi:hypothetical protein